MTFASERYASRRDTLAFVACLLLSVVARTLPHTWGDAIASGIRGSLLAPLLALEHQAELTKTSRARFAAVVAERDSAALLNGAVGALLDENQRLRTTLGLSGRLPVRHVTAEVLHQALPTDGFTLLLSAGRAQGVQPLAPVIAPAGLLGVVMSVEARTSVAITWAHPDFRASAMTLDDAVFGVVAPAESDGPNSMLMQLHGVPYRENVPSGAPVFTSGLGGVYPRSIPLGRVLAVADEGEGWTRTYLVRPAVHPASVSHVIILTSPAPSLAPAYPTSEVP